MKIRNIAFLLLFLGNIIFCFSMFQWPYNIFTHIWSYWWEDFWQFELFAGLSTIGMVVIVLSFIVWLSSFLLRNKRIKNVAYLFLFLGSALFCYSMFQWHYNIYIHDALHSGGRFWPSVWISAFGMGVVVFSFLVCIGTINSKMKIKNVAFLLLFVGSILFSLSMFHLHYSITYTTAPIWWRQDFPQHELFPWISGFAIALIVLSFIIWLCLFLQKRNTQDPTENS
jgi:hypothetical protein